MKGQVYPEEAVTVWAARRVGRPVKWIATRAEAQSMALPLHNHMSEADVERVVAALESVA